MGILTHAGWGALASAAGTLGWLADSLPRLAYGTVTVATLHGLDRR